MSNKKTRQSREVFLDFTMNDDNNLLEQINEVNKGFALNIPSDASKVKHTKVTMAKNEDKGKTVNNMKKSNLSIDLAGTNEFQTPTLDDLVKETEELIGTISETVQETAKISSQKIDTDLKTVAATMFTTKEELPKTMNASEHMDSVFESPFDKLDAFPTIEQDLRDADPYTPHFINEDLLQDTIGNSELGMKTSPFMGDALSAADLFDDVFDEENDVLNQTGSFLFNTKDLHLFSQDGEAEEVVEIIKQVDIAQTIPETEIEQISEISRKINDLERTGLPEKPNVVEAESVSTSLSDATFSGTEFSSPELLEVEEKSVADDTDLIVDEPTVVAKVEDINILLQKLDELSEKEMLSSLTSGVQTKKEDMPKIDARLDNHFAEMTSDPPEFTSGNDVSKDKTLMSLTANVLTPEINESETKVKASEIKANNEQTIIMTPPASIGGTSLNGTEAVNVERVSPVVSHHIGQTQTTTEEPERKTMAEIVANMESTQPINIAEMPTKTTTIGAVQGIEAEQDLKVKAGEAPHNVNDLTITQPINLAEIEKMSAHIETTQPITPEQNAKSAPNMAAQQATQATNVEPPPESVPNMTTEQAANVEPIAEPAPSMATQQPADITHFEHSFEQVFAQATMNNAVSTEQMLHTDELMNLHEEMKRVEAEKAQALASEEEPIDLEIGNQVTNPLDFPDVYFVNGSGSVSSSAYHATSTVNYATYLDATTQENNQLSALVNNELHFSETEQQEPQKVEPETVNMVSSKPLEKKINTKITAKRQVSEPIQTEPESPVRSSVIADLGTRQTGRTKPATFADTGTTLVNLSTVSTVDKFTRSTSAAKSKSILDDDEDLFEEKAVRTSKQKATTDKITNQILVIVVIALVIVILALLGFIIFNTLM